MHYELICEDFKLTDSIKTSIEENLNHMESSVPENSIVHVYLSEPTKKRFKVIFQLKFQGKDIIANKEGFDLYKLVNDTRKTFEKNLHQQMKRFHDRNHGKGA